MGRGKGKDKYTKPEVRQPAQQHKGRDKEIHVGVTNISFSSLFLSVHDTVRWQCQCLIYLLILHV